MFPLVAESESVWAEESTTTAAIEGITEALKTTIAPMCMAIARLLLIGERINVCSRFIGSFLFVSFLICPAFSGLTMECAGMEKTGSTQNGSEVAPCES